MDLAALEPRDVAELTSFDPALVRVHWTDHKRAGHSLNVGKCSPIALDQSAKRCLTQFANVSDVEKYLLLANRESVFIDSEQAQDLRPKLQIAP